MKIAHAHPFMRLNHPILLNTINCYFRLILHHLYHMLFRLYRWLPYHSIRSHNISVIYYDHNIKQKSNNQTIFNNSLISQIITFTSICPWNLVILALYIRNRQNHIAFWNIILFSEKLLILMPYLINLVLLLVPIYAEMIFAGRPLPSPIIFNSPDTILATPKKAEVPRSIPQIMKNQNSINIIEGESNRVRGYNNIVFGNVNHAVGIGNNLAGSNNKISGLSNQIQGVHNQIYKGSDNLIEGVQNLLKGNENNVIGSLNVLAGIKNEVKGEKNIISGQENAIKGFYNILQGDLSSIAGNKNTVLGSHNKMKGNQIFVLGKDNIAVGDKSIVFGDCNNIQNSNNIVLGRSNFINGQNNNLLSNGNKIQGGGNTIASGRNFIIGNQNIVGTSDDLERMKLKFRALETTMYKNQVEAAVRSYGKMGANAQAGSLIWPGGGITIPKKRN